MHVNVLPVVPGEDHLTGLVTGDLCLVSTTQNLICKGAPAGDVLDDAPTEDDLAEDVLLLKGLLKMLLLEMFSKMLSLPTLSKMYMYVFSG